ncbi:TPA: KdsC family phosphatase [Enterococcus faecium]
MKKKIKYLVMDVDGTLTDGKIYIGESGELFKSFDIKDGCGIRDILIPSGIKPIIITGRKSIMLERRCKELGIEELHQGIRDKISVLNEILHTAGDTLENVSYIGDDINDLTCMNAVKAANGYVGCPHDAVEKVKRISDYIASRNGGNGAVREFIEWLEEE